MPGQRGLRVLLIDDGRGLAKRGPCLRLTGHEVRVADSAAALETARTASPDVLVLELNQADAGQAKLILGMHEREGLRKPLVVALAEPRVPDADRRAKEAGVHLVLVKPIDPALLIGVLRRFRDMLVNVEGFAPVM